MSKTIIITPKFMIYLLYLTILKEFLQSSSPTEMTFTASFLIT